MLVCLVDRVPKDPTRLFVAQKDQTSRERKPGEPKKRSSNTKHSCEMNNWLSSRRTQDYFGTDKPQADVVCFTKTL